jgi:hypothetical protein
VIDAGMVVMVLIVLMAVVTSLIEAKYLQPSALYEYYVMVSKYLCDWRI